MLPAVRKLPQCGFLWKVRRIGAHPLFPLRRSTACQERCQVLSPVRVRYCGNGQFGEYNIDICLCIDKTGSMSPIIDTVKENALNLYQDIRNSLEKKGKHVSRLRVKVIWFGDYLANKTPLVMSNFLTLPDEMEQFTRLVNGVYTDGGGDEPEDGLEALAYAMGSDWCKDGWRKRHIIALFTDASAHDLGHGRSASAYPFTGMPDTAM